MSEEAQTEDEPSIEEILDSIRQIISEDEEIEEEEASTAEATPEPEPEPEPTPEPEAEDEPLDQSAIDDIDFDAPAMDPAPPEPEEEPEPEPVPETEQEDVLELTELVNTDNNNIDVDMVADEEFDVPDEEPETEPLDQSAIDDIDFDTPVEEGPVVEPEPIPAPEPTPEPIAVPEPTPEVAPEPVKEGDSLLTGATETAALSAISNLVRKTAIVNNSLTLEDIVRAELKPLLRDWLDKHLPTVIERLVKEELERVSKRVLDD